MDETTGTEKEIETKYLQPTAVTCNFRYRIKMCTGVNHKDLITVHHEMAHIQYFLSYRDKPKVFRDGANAGTYIY